MNLGIDFHQDREFQKLLGRRSDVDLVTAALELARDADPEVDFDAVRRWIDDRAGEVAGPMALAPSEEIALQELGRCLSRRHGLRGRSNSYDSPESSFLHRVIERKSGIPISLSVLYMAVSERAGWPLHGVSSPQHFLTRFEAGTGPLFIDAFAGGEVLPFEECLERFERSTGMTGEALRPLFEPAAPRTIVIRMLNNLKSLYAAREQWHAAWRVQARLTALQPASYAERRDFALISVKAERFGLAVDHLAACLRECPQEESQVLEQQMSEARRRVATWN